MRNKKYINALYISNTVDFKTIASNIQPLFSQIKKEKTDLPELGITDEHIKYFSLENYSDANPYLKDLENKIESKLSLGKFDDNYLTQINLILSTFLTNNIYNLRKNIIDTDLNINTEDYNRDDTVAYKLKLSMDKFEGFDQKITESNIMEDKSGNNMINFRTITENVGTKFGNIIKSGTEMNTDSIINGDCLKIKYVDIDNCLSIIMRYIMNKNRIQDDNDEEIDRIRKYIDEVKINIYK